MIVWRICGNEIGPNGNRAYYFAAKTEAEKVRRSFVKDSGSSIDPPEKIEVRNRDELVAALHDAMGYGAS